MGTEWQFDARHEHVARQVKRELLAALADLGPLRPDPLVAEVVFGELLSNVVRHTPGSASVSFALEDGHVVLSVFDRGPMFRLGDAGIASDAVSDEAECGRGLCLIAALCDRIGIEPRSDGKCTTVVLPRAEVDAWLPCAPEGAVTG